MESYKIIAVLLLMMVLFCCEEIAADEWPSEAYYNTYIAPAELFSEQSADVYNNKRMDGRSRGVSNPNNPNEGGSSMGEATKDGPVGDALGWLFSLSVIYAISKHIIQKKDIICDIKKKPIR